MFFSTSDIERAAHVKFQFIELEIEGHNFIITLNRPEKRNAFTPTMITEIGYALSCAEADRHIWCILIRAKGPVFCAGMDLLVFQDPELDTKNHSLPEPNKVVNLGDAFRLLTKPSVAQVEGAVYAGGFLITCGCTFVVATEDAEFSLPEVKRGLFPMQVISSLLQHTSQLKALQFCILAESCKGAAAKEFGLVSHVCTREKIEQEVDGILEKIISHSPFAISKGMQTLRALGGIPEYARFGFLASQLEEIKKSEDAQEGITAFKEKRTPSWKNS
jgi:enoyl-CoA hydratase/carnithine racemase